jgi:hypothetical protein
MQVKALLLLPLLLAAALRADEASDRAAIDRTIDALNDPDRREAVFAKDSDAKRELDSLVGIHRPQAVCLSGMGRVVPPETWSILTVPHIGSGTVRFLAAGIALVDGESTVDGAITLLRRVPLLFVVKREDDEWRIVSVRVLAR